MKIVVIGPLPPYRGGISHFTQTLAVELGKAGNEVLPISYRKQYPKLLYPGKSDKDYSQKTALEDANFIFSPLNPFDWAKTLKEIKNYAPDLVVYPWWTTFWSPATAWLLKKLRNLNVPVKVLVHNALPHEEGWLDKQLTKFALKDARSFITMAEKETNRLKAVVNPLSTIETTTHPIYAQFPKSGLSKPELREELGLPQDKTVALFFGFVRPYKGLKVLLDAFGLLEKDKAELHLVVAGEFWDDKSEYERQITDLGVSERVTIRADYIPDAEVGMYFEVADFFVAPYLDGSQSGSIKLAMAYNLPLIVSDVITDPLILGYQSGLSVFESGKPAQLAEAIKALRLSDRAEAAPAKGVNDKSWQDLLEVLTSD